MKRLILVALNEFNVDFLAMAQRRWGLEHVGRLLGMAHARSWTDDEEEHKGLDPWAQWPSVHTGLPLSRHGMRRLGDVENMELPQLWNTLEKEGVRCGVWGAMNAAAGRDHLPQFFLPDPWTLSESARPSSLEDFLDLPRYYAGNYLAPRFSRMMVGVLRMLRFLALRGPLAGLSRELPQLLAGPLKVGLDDHVLFSQFDLINTRVFLKYHRRFAPDFSFLFLNSIAHLQHHAWSDRPGDEKHVRYSMRILDRILGLLFEKLDDHDFLVMNGLGQRNIHAVKQDVLYRQVDPAGFLRAMEIPFSRVEQRMTNDAFVRFESSSDRETAERKLRSAEINGQPMFDVETQGEHKLFFQLDYWKPAGQLQEFQLDGKSFSLFDHFEAVVTRTGEHVPEGDIYATFPLPSGRIMNHQVHDIVLDYFRRSRGQ